MRFWKNRITICVSGEEKNRFMNLCVYRNIVFSDVKIQENNYQMNLDASDFVHLKDIVRKTGCKVKIIDKKGLYFTIKKQAKRKVFVFFSILCLLVLWTASNLLWNVEIQGNYMITESMLEDFLQEEGIRYGVPLHKIPILELEKKLRNKYSEINWISMGLKGSTLLINMKENDTRDFEEFHVQTEGKNLTAHTDGIVESVLVREGTGVVSVGTEVKKGDVLIEGEVIVPSEDGTIKNTKYCKADGDVWLVYEVPVREKLFWEYERRKYTGNELKKNVIYVGGKKWGLDIRKIPYLKYDCIEETREYPWMEILSVPWKIQTLRYREYVIVREKYDKEQATKLLTEKLNKIILSLEEKGVQIIEKNVKIDTNSAYLSIQGNLKVRELCTKLEDLEESQ